MLSVNEGRSRARSKSRERSRTREVRAPSPEAPRAPPPPPSRRKQAYESDSEALSDGIDDPRYARPRPDDRDRDRDPYDPRREDDYRRAVYEDDRRRPYEEDRRRREYDDDEDRREARYAKPSKYEYARPEPPRQDSYGKTRDDDYELPGAYKDYDERETRPRGADRPVKVSAEMPYRPHAGSVSSRGGMYAQPTKYEYAKAPAEVRYTSKNDPYAASERGASYTAKSSAEIEIERRRHRREPPDEDIMKRYEEIARKQLQEEEIKKQKPVKTEKERETELTEKYKRELEAEKEKELEKERKKPKPRDAYSSDSEEETSRPRRRKYSDEEREYRQGSSGKKYVEIEPRRRRDSRERHAPVPDRQEIVIRPRGESSGLKSSELGGVRRPSVSAGSGALMLMAPGGHHAPIGGGLPPGSPLLEAYRGTYQSISPMPSPMALPVSFDDGLSDLEQLDDDPRVIRPRQAKIGRRVEIYDPEPDAKLLGAELMKKKSSAAPLIKILPALSDDNLLALRAEYKKHFKSSGKPINITKHIKAQIVGNIGKIAYATSLGRWESEAYWANCWYQAGSSRRELLIESLLGRPNKEIRKIKEAFRDKRYNDSLIKCMETELKKDKFRHAILLALDEQRMDEVQSLSRSLIRADVDTLYKALTGREGGETAMIDIIVVRSDNHLREVLKEFELRYRTNFAKQMIQKSQNLVGETLAHILNGVLNRPVRDALLLHQALAETSKERAELLMSRLIRYHWEPKHLELVKMEYRTRYKTRLEHDIRDGFTKGEFGDFCIALCEGAHR